MAKQKGPRKPRTKKIKNDANQTSPVEKEETIVGNVNEPGSGRHEPPPIHGNDPGPSEWPR